MQKNANKRPLKAALIIGIAAFIGFCLIFPLMIFTTTPDYWAFALLYLFYFITSGQIFIGLGLSVLISIISYSILRFLIKRDISKSQLGWIVFFVSGIAFTIGYFTFLPTQTFVMERDFGKERIGTVDTNNDGKPDKWVHHNVYDKLLEIDYDTNFDGKPDIWEYYQDSKVVKKEIDTDFDAKVDKVEKY